MAKKRFWKNIDKETIFTVLGWAALILVVYFVIRTVDIPGGMGGEERHTCPYSVEGNLNATFTIRYIDSPYCVWCWIQEPVLNKMLEQKGDLFRLEKYDIRYCDEIVNRHGFAGTPSFVFDLGNGKELAHSGYINEKHFSEIICDATKGC